MLEVPSNFGYVYKYMNIAFLASLKKSILYHRHNLQKLFSFTISRLNNLPNNYFIFVINRKLHIYMYIYYRYFDNMQSFSI